MAKDADHCSDYQAAQDAEIATLGDFGDQFAQLEGVREQVWWRELEDRWPVIREVARLLMSGENVSSATVADLLEKPELARKFASIKRQ